MKANERGERRRSCMHERIAAANFRFSPIRDFDLPRARAHVHKGDRDEANEEEAEEEASALSLSFCPVDRSVR